MHGRPHVNCSLWNSKKWFGDFYLLYQSHQGICKKKCVLKECIWNEIQTSHSCVGYRQMSNIVSLKYGINVFREKVCLDLGTVYSEGVAGIYETKGPHKVDHIDDNDKSYMNGWIKNMEILYSWNHRWIQQKDSVIKNS